MKEGLEKTDIDREGAATLDDTRWSFVNEWQVASQGDDRIPMNGAVETVSQTASGQRASARRSHQMRYKEWSKERHD